MLNDAHPAIVIALGILLWAYLMGTAVTAAISIANLSTNLAGGARQSAEPTPGDAGPSVGGGLGHVLGLADTAAAVDGIWAVVRLRRHDGEGTKTIRCSLRLIEAATENEAWGRLWSALLTSGITPTIDGGSLVWQEPDPNGGQAHFGISLLPAQSHADRRCRTPSG